jgi:hypothetical protein
MKTKFPFLLSILACLILTISCNNGDKMTEQTTQFPKIKDVPESAWKKLSQKKIYFGHQSVGFNIMDGITDLMKENPQIKLNIVETSNQADFKVGIFAHSRVGKNRDCKSKNNELMDFMRKGIGKKADLAFFKYCYVDITARTDIDKTFDEYKKTMTVMKNEYPSATFIHITTPLVSLKPTGLKAWIKKIIGRFDGNVEDNIKRNKFNERMRKEFGKKDHMFDLATIESTYPDGKRCTFNKDGKTHYAMVPTYTNDGGHLNELGRKVVAQQLLIFLAELEK